jgi:hypothetical protein
MTTKFNKCILYYYTTDYDFRIADLMTTATTMTIIKFHTEKNLPVDENINKFSMFKGYDGSDDGLREFCKDFNIWRNELKSFDISILYTKYYNHHSATFETFKRLSGYKEDKLRERRVKKLEGIWVNKCFNAGLTYFKEPMKCMSYGYDFKLQYPSCLASKKFKVPLKEGSELTINDLQKEKKLKYGMYRVRITSDNKHVKKVFKFSPNHTYTHYSLKFAMKHKELFNFNIELVDNGQPNAYVYDECDLISGKEYFGNWFDNILKMRRKFPKNKLVKNMGSSLWGLICEYKKFNVTRDDLFSDYSDESKYTMTEKINFGNEDYYVLKDLDDPYENDLARIKPFLTSFARNKTAEVVMCDLENVVRVHTDGVAFINVDPKPDFPLLESEEKTSGMINWISLVKHPKCD